MGKLENKHAKELDKLALQHFKKLGKSKGFNVVRGEIYKLRKGFFFTAIVNVGYVKDEYVLSTPISVRVKPVSMIDIYWDLLNHSEYKEKPVSFKASCPHLPDAVPVDSIIITIENDDVLEARCNEFLTRLDEIIEQFLNKVNDVNTYYKFVKTNHTYERETMLYILLEMLLENYEKSNELLEAELKAGRTGNLTIGNKNVYHFALEYNKIKLGKNPLRKVSKSFKFAVVTKKHYFDNYSEFSSWVYSSIRKPLKEEQDYSINSTSDESLVNFYKDIILRFPSIYGEFAVPDEVLNKMSSNELSYLAEYYITDNIIECSLNFSSETLEFDDFEYILDSIKKHDVIFYQTLNILNFNFPICFMKSSKTSYDIPVGWDTICNDILYKRGIDFTLYFKENNTDNESMKFKTLDSKVDVDRTGKYLIEVTNGDNSWELEVDTQEELMQCFKEFYDTRKIPNTTQWVRI